MRYLIWVDLALTTPQNLQIQICRDQIYRIGGAVTFYGGDDILVHDSLPLLREKCLSIPPSFEAVCFFDLRQILRCKKPLDIVREIFRGKEVIAFAAQSLYFPRADSEKLSDMLRVHWFSTYSSEGGKHALQDFFGS